jgi:hypothetical protein
MQGGARFGPDIDLQQAVFKTRRGGFATAPAGSLFFFDIGQKRLDGRFQLQVFAF